MNILIEKAKPSDAAELLEYLKIIGSESDNLTFGAEGLPLSIEEEQDFLASQYHSSSSITLVAKKEGKIVGNARFTGALRERTKHRGDIGISVMKSEWGQGIGSMLLETLIDFASNKAQAELITLEVKNDNERAIALYEKYGFKKMGCFKGFSKVNGKYLDFDMMYLYL